MSDSLDNAEYRTAALHLTAAKMFSLASCVMLFYDILITFGDEVEKIWRQRFTGATVLWFLNRYISPLGYIVVIVSFQDPSWGPSACNRFVLYPEALKIVTSFTIGVIFILRLYAIYSRSRVILIGFALLLFAEIALKIWAFTDGVRLQLPPGLVGCILTGRSSPGDRIIYTWVAELIFDSCVFFATIYKTIYLYRRTSGTASVLIRIIMRDGVMYFAVIFVSNLVTVLIFVAAPPDLKVVNASFSTLITSLMVSRLMLNLRHGPEHPTNIHYTPRSTTILHERKVATIDKQDRLQSTMIGNLGQPVSIWTDEENDVQGSIDEDVELSYWEPRDSNISSGAREEGAFS